MSEKRPLVAPAFEAWTIVLILISALAAAEYGELDGRFWQENLILVILVLAITRRRSNLARLVFTIASVAGLGVWIVRDLRPAGWDWIDWLWIAVPLVDLAFIWSPPMSRWIRSRPRPPQSAELLAGCGKVLLIALGLFATLSILGLWSA